MSSDSSYPTVKSELHNTVWDKHVTEVINPLTGEKTVFHDYVLSIKFGASCRISEEDEKNHPDMLEYMREDMEHKLEHYIDSLVFNKINRENRNGFFETVHGDAPVVVLHPKHIVDIIQDGEFVKKFNLYDSSPTTIIEDDENGC